ncbi:flagellar basal body rod protein FlgC [Lignipirellula cremea]|uniref:Flagellar basal-body rod protein FlgC n=1 Tax=Lignipirellula cremea TaxID=2528010 RepID=A0A518DQ92_9BACT|nr:flagellar basal body rod protein FlgC [Lignipirellula cremea]QDU93974.1 Flagellar basal-body rod protein FlgC [Lignipirellula cremea]
MNTALDISTSALVAQRMRLNAISGNIANMTTARNEEGEAEPYQARFVVFEPDESMRTSGGGVGVKVASVETETKEPLLKYQPNHPLANDQGYVAYPNINLTSEFVDALEATRAYEANIGVMEITKNMGRETLRIIG